MTRSIRTTGVALLAMALGTAAQAGQTSRDTLDQTLQSVLKTFGREVPADRVACMTGSAFAPAFNTHVNCTSGWEVHSLRGIPHLTLVGKELGLNIVEIEATGSARTQAVRKAIAAGSVVITDGGWNEASVEEFAGTVKGVRDDGSLYGVPASGEKEVAVSESSRLWVVSPMEKRLQGWRCNHEMMEAAIDRIEGIGPYEPNGHAFGVDAIDRIIERMEDVQGYCTDCKEEGWRCASMTLAAMNDNFKMANRVLRSALPSAPQACHRGISRAAGFYRRMNLLLEPRIKDESMKAIVGDLERQREFSRKVLVPIRRDLLGVVRYMQEAIQKG